MNICFVNPTRLPRPPIYVIAKGLADRGHTCTVLQPSSAWPRYPAWDNVKVVTLPCRYMPEIRWTLPPLRLEYRILAQLVSESKCDLVHCLDYFTLPALPPIWIRRRMGVPISLVNNALVGIGWQYGKWPFDHLTKLYTYSLGRLVLRSYNRLFFLYEGLAQETRQLLKGKMPPYQVIPNGVDLNHFYPVPGSSKRHELGIRDSEQVILFVGRLVAVKRVEWIVALTRRLLSQGLRVRTIIVGGGSLGNPDAEQRYHDLAADLGKAVLFTGPQPQESLREYYSIADLVVQSSRSEGTPSVLREAAACAVPSVASDVGDTGELVQHNVTGYVFPRDDFEAMVGYVRQVLKNPSQAREMGHRAREIVRSRYSWPLAIDKYERAFEAMINDASGRDSGRRA
jgi:glycosyltransferase involved in cell wall biosynthesis